jgi:hypothetical protein
VVDKDDHGVRRKRKIPKAVTVQYIRLDNNHVVTEENRKICSLLRAIEIQKGWAPAGEIVHPEDLDL